ncbi:hypothetical protein BN874_1620002 [Candidatus Contendobacter odensis Run_B_J11]|uniref:Uncharacterized protein n=1 Tax=Candidatus Contendobacter odensis Run_B_J11 TaxID=1400861 RepID=A0A7U7G9E0_9GAMM|nr:hypothetical protein BN874_1620002 [Candidatus Contendobacter odensis Run_B_J11]
MHGLSASQMPNMVAIKGFYVEIRRCALPDQANGIARHNGLLLEAVLKNYFYLQLVAND